MKNDFLFESHSRSHAHTLLYAHSHTHTLVFKQKEKKTIEDVNTEGPDKKIMMISQELNVVHGGTLSSDGRRIE